MSSQNKILIIVVISAVLIAKLHLVESTNSGQFTGFLVSSAHILFVAISSIFILRKKS